MPICPQLIRTIAVLSSIVRGACEASGLPLTGSQPARDPTETAMDPAMDAQGTAGATSL